MLNCFPFPFTRVFRLLSAHYLHQGIPKTSTCLKTDFTIIEGQKNKTIHIDSNSVTILGHLHNGIILQLLPESTCFSFEIMVKYGNPSEVSITKAIISQESKTLKDSENST